ncbi:Exoglucanase 1 [Agyrium rufum]|nr:Exoglucanase 1 [Agyrium rufum]
MSRTLALASSLLALAYSQSIGTNTAEVHPVLTTQKCTTAGGCVTQNTNIVLDANWRWVHSNAAGSLTNCYNGNEWDTTLCPDPKTCAANCALEGADYPGTYGINAQGNSLTLKFVTTGNAAGPNVGSRVYLMNGNKYQMFNMLNQEFTFDVDVSTLPCGLNGALYFSEMAADGGMAAYPSNKAGAAYGTGYCDSQCPHDIKFINGQANSADWTGTTTNSGKGSLGSCCSEMDIWEANSVAAAYTPHPCTPGGLTACTDCTAVCDQAGCDFNSYRMGNTSFYGPGKTVDTTKKFTVVTQFVTTDGTANGDLKEIRRIYVQNGVIIQNSLVNQPNIDPVNSITDNFCAQQKTEFTDSNVFAAQGGLKQMGAAFKAGMVLVLSIWDDTAVAMEWLDSDYPTTADPTLPGIARGNCATTAGQPADVEKNSPNAQVIYSNIKTGDIGSTFTGTGGAAPPAPPKSSSTVAAPPKTSSTVVVTPPKSTSTAKVSSTSVVVTPPKSSAAPVGTVPKYGQCGGIGYSGATTCAAGSTCKVSNPYYSQCL